MGWLNQLNMLTDTHAATQAAVELTDGAMKVVVTAPCSKTQESVQNNIGLLSPV